MPWIEGDGLTPSNLNSKVPSWISSILSASNLGIYNVRDYGAVGNGSTDDTTSIQSTLNAAAGGGTAFFPASSRSYVASSTLSASGVRIKAESGATLFVTSQVTGITYVGTSPVEIDGLDIVGTATPATANVTGVLLNANSKVHNSTISGWNVCVQSEGSRTRVTDNVCYAIGGSSGQGYGVLVLAPDTFVADNDMVVGRHGAYISGNATYGGAQRAIVTGNRITVSSASAGGSGIKVYATDSQDALAGVIVASNVVQHTNLIGGLALGIEAVDNVRDCSITGNTVVDTDSQALRAVASANVASCPQRIVFSGNVVSTTTGFFVRVEVGSGATAPTDCVFIGNGTTRNSTTAIDDDGIRTTIVGNAEYGDSRSAYTLTNGDTTPSVYKGEIFTCANVSQTTITDFDDGRAGQSITVLLDANTAVASGSSIALAGAANVRGAAGTILRLSRINGAWREVGRGDIASRVTDGSATLPGMSFSSEASLGFYRSAASHVQLSYGTLTASGVSTANVRTPIVTIRDSAGFVNYLTAAGSDRWMVGINLGGYASDELVINDRQAINTGTYAFVQGAGFAVGRGATFARSATSGFIYVSSTTDTPTGTPTAVTGKIPLFYDTGNNYLWVYNGSWRSIAAIG